MDVDDLETVVQRTRPSPPALRAFTLLYFTYLPSARELTAALPGLAASPLTPRALVRSRGFDPEVFDPEGSIPRFDPGVRSLAHLETGPLSVPCPVIQPPWSISSLSVT